MLTGLVKDLVDHDIRMLSDWKGCEVIELNVQPDHVHLVVSIPPRVSVSELMCTLKGKLAIKFFKSYPQLKKKPYWGTTFGQGGILSTRLVSMKIIFVGMSSIKRVRIVKRRVRVLSLIYLGLLMSKPADYARSYLTNPPAKQVVV